MSKVCAFVVLLLVVVVAGALDGATAKDNTMVMMGMQISPSPAPAPAPALTPSAIDCGGECSRRCSKTWNKKMCMRMCGICCGKCKCVPSGSAGNKDECPCYRDWKNKKGKDKCP